MADETLDETAGKVANQAADDGLDLPGADWGEAMTEQKVATGKSSKPARFEELGDGTTAHTSSQNLNFLLDIPLTVTVEMGRTSLIINRLLQLTQGSVVELDKVAGEAVEIFINNKLLGKGEVVVVNDRFGVRITEIISQADRIKNIG